MRFRLRIAVWWLRLRHGEPNMPMKLFTLRNALEKQNIWNVADLR